VGGEYGATLIPVMIFPGRAAYLWDARRDMFRGASFGCLQAASRVTKAGADGLKIR
jgi:hypothetical protein